MLPEVVQEMAAGHRVAVAWLLEFQFASSTQRFWSSIGYKTLSGFLWQGAGDVISVSGLDHGRGMTASAVTFTLSGANPELVAIAADSADEVAGRPCGLYFQFLDEATGDGLDSRIAAWIGTMDVMSFSATAESQSITLSAEGLFVRRASAPFGYLTDADQQVRYPGDVGLAFMPQLRNKNVKWLRQ